MRAGDLDRPVLRPTEEVGTRAQLRVRNSNSGLTISYGAQPTRRRERTPRLTLRPCLNGTRLEPIELADKEHLPAVANASKGDAAAVRRDRQRYADLRDLNAGPEGHHGTDERNRP